jgi:hypothetical protein
MPPRVTPKEARLLRLEDVDRGVKRWFEDVVAAEVATPQGERRKVTISFSAGERWVTAADRKGVRDRDGRLILPIIQVRRTGTDPVSNMTALGANVPRLQVSRLVHRKSSALADADYARPLSERRMTDSAVYEVWTVPFPVTMTLRYDVVVQAQYNQQMNQIIEKILWELEFFDVPSFVISLAAQEREQGVQTGQGSTERVAEDVSEYSARPPMDDYYVVGYVDGDIGDGSNLDEFTDEERIIQLRFSFKVPAALMLDPEGEHPAVHMQTTAFGIDMGDEEVIVVDDRADLDRIFGPK